MMVQLLVPIVCSVSLLALVGALIFNPMFRRDIMAGQGEATVFGVLSVKGVVIVILSGLFLGALILSSQSLITSESKNGVSGFLVDDVIPLIEQKHASEIRNVDQTTDRLKSGIDSFIEKEWTPAFLSMVMQNRSVVEAFKKSTDLEEKQRIIQAVLTEASRQVTKKRRELINPIDEGYRYKISSLRSYYRKILVAAAGQNLEDYRKMINEVPQERILVDQVESQVLRVLNDTSRGKIDSAEAAETLIKLINDFARAPE